MSKVKNPNRVVLVRLPGLGRNALVDIWDVKTRAGRITLGDVRKWRNPNGGNPYLAGLPNKELGSYRTRTAAVSAVIAAAQAAVAEAQP
jgi:hypothetical protein